MANANLHAAKKNKNDEFYTRLEDISNEMRHYKDHFKDKVVYCNCDDATWSNFWRYFHLSFAHLGLKKLISTGYNPGGTAYKAEYTGGNDNDISVCVKTDLTGDGDFRSEESIECLKEADIVVTNPPFSLFREYVAQLMEYDKKFLIIGNVNAVTYKEFFPLIKEGKVWSGFSFNKTMEFIMPDDYVLKGKAYIDANGKKHGFVPSVAWYTNLDISKRHETIDLFKKYTPEEYPTYDNFDAINIDRVAYIPKDYDGVMGVPLTFMDKYNPEQFEIVGYLDSSTDEEAGIPNLRYYNDFKEMRQDMSYTGARGGKANGNPVVQGKSAKGNFFYNPKTGEYVHSKYSRITIKRNPNFIDE